MPVPMCATCHLSGLDGLRVTHDTTERQSWWPFAPVSERRPAYDRARTEMQETCLRCDASSSVARFYEEAEATVAATNERVREGQGGTRFNEAAAHHRGELESAGVIGSGAPLASMRPRLITAENIKARPTNPVPDGRFNEAAAHHRGELCQVGGWAGRISPLQ